MRKAHNRLTLIVCILMMLTWMTACSGTATPSPAAAASASAEAATATPDVTAPPASGEKVELIFLMPNKPFIQDMATNAQTLWVEEQTNVHVTWQSLPQQEAESKLNVIIASGDLPDVFFSCSITNAMLSKYGVDEKVFLPLDDLIDKHCVNLKEAASKASGGLDTLRMIDGKLYSLPTFDTCQHCEQSAKMWLYDPFVQTLGVPYPTTTEEFYQYLKKIASTDLNGNGKNDEVPLAGSATGWHDRVEEFLLNAFVYYDYSANGFYLKDNKVLNALSSSEYREGLKYIKKLYDEKLIYEGSLTQDAATLTKLVEGSEQPIVGAAAGGWVGMFSNFGGDRAKGFHTLAPLAGPAGFKTTPNFPSLPYQGQFVLSNTCKNPEAAVKYGDFLYTKESTLICRAGGAKDDFWRDATAGEKDFYGKPAVWAPVKAWNDTVPQNASWISLGVWDYTDLRASQAVKEGIDYWGEEGLEYMLFKETVEKYKPVTQNYFLLPRTYTVEEQEEVAMLETQFKKFFDSSQYNFITGKSSLDSDWNKYLSDLDGAGLQRLTELYQKAYDRQYAKK